MGRRGDGVMGKWGDGETRSRRERAEFVFTVSSRPRFSPISLSPLLPISPSPFLRSRSPLRLTAPRRGEFIRDVHLQRTLKHLGAHVFHQSFHLTVAGFHGNH